MSSQPKRRVHAEGADQQQRPADKFKEGGRFSFLDALMEMLSHQVADKGTR